MQTVAILSKKFKELVREEGAGLGLLVLLLLCFIYT